MKLRNKLTGEIAPTSNIVVGIGNDGKWYESLSQLNEEWEDAPEEPKEYWFIRDHTSIVGYAPVNNSDVAKYRKEIVGNYFETKEEAEKAVEKLKAWKRLKDKNFHFLKYSALGCGEIEFSLDFEDMDDEGEIGELRHDLDLLFGGEE